MKTQQMLFLIVLILGLLAVGCSNGNPTTPSVRPDINYTGAGLSTGTTLLGYYTVHLDPERGVVEAVPNRDVMYAVNVNMFLNMNPLTLGFNFNDVTVNADSIDVDLDVSISHPLPGNTKFNGYDVRGVMIGNGSANMAGDSELLYAVEGVDQYLKNADGYTRWWNQPEFIVGGLFGYTPGLYGSKLFNGTATLNGYKYFADGLGADEDAMSFLQMNPNVFSSGAVNTRNYKINFPLPSPAIKYDYAILADWAGGPPEFHPSPATEAVAFSATISEGLSYSLTAGGSGDLIFDLGLLSNSEIGGYPSTVVVDATVLSEPAWLDMGMYEPTEIGDNYTIWHIEIPADNIITATGNEMMIGAQYPDYDYSNPFDIPNNATAPLTAYFRAAIPVELIVPDNFPPYIEAGVEGATEANADETKDYTVTAVDPDLDPLTYDWTVTDLSDQSVVFSGPGDGNGTFTVDWAGDVGATAGDEYQLNCSVTDGNYPAVMAAPLDVLIVSLDVVTLYLYDGEVDDGGIVNWELATQQSWAYCSGVSAWDENECGPYFIATEDAICHTPVIEFPAAGEYSELHIEITHWGEMQEDGQCYVSPGIIDDLDDWQPNWSTEALIYLEGFDFNDDFVDSWQDWSGTFGSETSPEWSHFDCSAYEGQTARFGFQFGEYGAGNPDTQDGYNVRKIWIYYVP